MTTPLYYVYPFGQFADDLTAIPTNAAVDGSVSYNQGFTAPYEYNLLTNPAALPIARGQFNQLMFDITNNIQEYQQYGTPQWVVGNTVSYPIYSRVYYNNLVYESQVGSNTATPGADATWLVVSGPAVNSTNIVTLTSSGTYTPSTGMINCIVELVGPGGGGAGCTSTAGNIGIGGPGGAGAYAKRSYTKAQLGANAAVVLPAGGAGGTAGNNGTTASSATFTPAGSGTALSCASGTGGTALNTQLISNNASITGGLGGAATGGEVNITGGDGSYTGSVAGGNFAIIGLGGSPAAYGSGSASTITSNTSPGQAPNGFGGGGGGSYTENAANQVGIAGGDSYLVITEFLAL